MLDFPQNGKAHVSNGNRTVRFGVFEVDLRSGELRKSGSRIRLQDQPFKVLQILLEHSGDLVTREELQARIWPEESFGDFDHAVNVAVGKLRTALGDSADDPSFIETVPRRGYRFVAPLDGASVETDPTEVSANGAHSSRALSRLNGTLLAALAILFAVILLGLGVFLGHRIAPSQLPDFQRLTVKHGTIYSARFAPGAYSVIYAASWDGAPIEIFSTELKFPWARSLGLPVNSAPRSVFLRRDGGITRHPPSFPAGSTGHAWASVSDRWVATANRRECRLGRLVSGWEDACRCTLDGRQTASGISPGPCFVRNSRLDQPPASIAEGRPNCISRPPDLPRRPWHRVDRRSCRTARKFSLPAGKQRKDWHGLRTEKRFGSRLLDPDSNAASTPSIFRVASVWFSEYPVESRCTMLPPMAESC